MNKEYLKCLLHLEGGLSERTSLPILIQRFYIDSFYQIFMSKKVKESDKIMFFQTLWKRFEKIKGEFFNP